MTCTHISSNKTLARTIEEYSAAKFTGDRASKRPDLFLAQNLRGGYLLIELKRPSEEIDRQDQRQAQEYRDDLELKFGQIEILLLGKWRDVTAAVLNATLAYKFLAAKHSSAPLEHNSTGCSLS